MQKSLKFTEHLVPLVLSGKKDVTWRLFDDKDLRVGDIVELINSNTKKMFGRGELVEIREKAFSDIDEKDFDGHEKFKNEDEMYETYKKYYGDRVDRDTLVKVIKFKYIPA